MAVEIDEWTSYGGGTEAKLELYQKKLLKIAQKATEGEVLSKHYIIYECQALIHWLEQDEEQAYDLILCAADVKDDNKLFTENGKNLLENAYSVRKNAKYKNLNGFYGWLALFTVSVGLSALICVIQFLLLPFYFTQLNSYQSQAPQFVDAATTLVLFESLGGLILAGLGIWVIILFRARKSLGRNVGIVFLLASLLLSFIDYSWYASITAAFNPSIGAVTSQGNTESAGSLLGAIIWIPYLLVSKRVRRTLIR
jgi:hypothetical protein